MNRSFPFSINDVTRPPGGDFGTVRQEIDEISRQVARSLDAQIIRFVEAIEGRSIWLVEIMESGRFVKLAESADAAPQGWETFFLWRGHALGYRVVTRNHTDDTKQVVTHEVTLETKIFAPEDEWPEGLRRALGG